MKKRYDKELKIMIAELAISGQRADEIASEYGIHEGTVRLWKRQYTGKKEAFTGSGTPSLTPEEKEIRELKKQLKETQIERDILKKVAAVER